MPPLVSQDTTTYRGDPRSSDWRPLHDDDFEIPYNAKASEDLSKNKLAQAQEYWIEYAESLAEPESEPLPSIWMNIHLKTTENLSMACEAWRRWVRDTLIAMMIRVGDEDSIQSLPDPKESKSAEMLSALHIKYTIALDVNLNLGLTPGQLLALMDDQKKAGGRNCVKTYWMPPYVRRF